MSGGMAGNERKGDKQGREGGHTGPQKDKGMKEGRRKGDTHRKGRSKKRDG